MPIPKIRAELTSQVRLSYEKLHTELDEAGPCIANLPCEVLPFHPRQTETGFPARDGYDRFTG